jgi:hypothetical protein
MCQSTNNSTQYQCGHGYCNHNFYLLAIFYAFLQKWQASSPFAAFFRTKEGWGKPFRITFWVFTTFFAARKGNHEVVPGRQKMWVE